MEKKMRKKEKEGTRALIRLGCRNMEKDNKYWLEEKWKICVFCGKGKNNMNDFMRNVR